jgi:SAM-dependent methyltransferase
MPGNSPREVQAGAAYHGRSQSALQRATAAVCAALGIRCGIRHLPKGRGGVASFTMGHAMQAPHGGSPMSDATSDKAFTGSIPEVYDALLVPLIFEPYAVDLARRLAARQQGRVLEIAAGTGVLTRTMAKALPTDVEIVASDLNQPMLDRACIAGTARPVEWRQADAMDLPFDDASFDAVVCQFGAMFFPDKPKAFGQARRVLRPGGIFLFSVWDQIEENEFADAVTAALARIFPDDPVLFMRRIPHGYFDLDAIRRDLAAAGFTAAPQTTTIASRSRADSPRVPAVAYCQGTPMRNEIVARDAARLEEATDAAEAEIARRFGRGPVDGRIQAHVIAVTS